MNETEAGVVGAGLLHAAKQRVSLAIGLQLVVLALLCIGAEVVEQAVHLGGGFCSLNCLTLCCGLLYGSLNSCKLGCLAAVQLLQEGHDFVCSVGLPELKGCGTLEKLTYTLRLLHARELHEDAAGAGNFLDVGLCHTKLVDTALHNCIGVVDCALCLFAEEIYNLIVSNLGLVCNVAAELVEVNVKREPLLTCNLFPSLCEKGDEIGVSLLCALTCQREGLVEFIGSLFAGAVAHQLAQVQLQHYVHTALEVQTQVDLFLLNILVCVAEINFLGGYGVDVLVVSRCADGIEIESLVKIRYKFKCGLELLCLYNTLCILCSLALLECCYQRKRELECAGQGDENCH